MYHSAQPISSHPASAFVARTLLGLLALAAALPASAQRKPPEEPLPAVTDEGPAIARKEPSFFGRPVERTPAAQWQRVERLEADKQLKAALRAANALVRTWHHSPEAAPAQLAVARLNEARGNPAAAFNEYQYLIDHFAGLFPFQEVLDRQYQIANHLLTPPKTFLGLAMNTMADVRLRFEQIVRNAPNWERAPDALFKAASCHELDDDPIAAAEAFAQLQTRYPAAPAALAAAAEEIRLRRALAEKYPLDEAMTRRAIAAIDSALNAYGGRLNRDELAAWRAELSDAAMNRAYARAAFYDGKRKQPRAALTAYREFIRVYPGSPHAETVRSRIRELEGAADDSSLSTTPGVTP
jgi:outer membrane protein assembly factor BamD